MFPDVLEKPALINIFFYINVDNHLVSQPAAIGISSFYVTDIDAISKKEFNILIRNDTIIINDSKRDLGKAF